MEKYIKDEIIPDYNSFGTAFPDGRLVEPGYNIPKFSFSNVYAETIKLGRPLTNEEFENFVVYEKELIPA